MQLWYSAMCKNKQEKRGQIFSLDAIFSIVLFFIILIFVFVTWNIYSLRINEQDAHIELQLLTFQITDILVESSGVPSNWEVSSANVSVIGLQKKPGILTQEKINALLLMDYENVKDSFNIERFDFEFQIVDGNGTIRKIGVHPENRTQEVITVRRIVYVENETKEIFLTLWRGKNA